MPYTESDLRRVLGDRSGDGTPPDDVLGAVHLGVRRRARRSRVATVVASSLVTASILGVAMSTHFRPTQVGPDASVLTPSTAQPASTARPTTPLPVGPTVAIPGLAATDHGGRLIAGGVIESPHEGALTVTFVAGDLPVHIFTDCRSEQQSLGWTLVLAYNGRVQDTGCSLRSTDSYEGKPAYEAMHVERGATVTLDVSIRTVANAISANPSVDSAIAATPDGVGPLTPAAERPRATIRVGVYEGGTDPIQPRHPVMAWLPVGQGHVVDARTVGATGSFTMLVTFGAATSVNLVTIAPGMLHVYANGVSVLDFGSAPRPGSPDVAPSAASYSGSWLSLNSLNSFSRLHEKAGDTVTLRIEASGFSSPGWQVVDDPNGLR